MRRVVITGIGVISPIGIGAKTFWTNLLAGQIGVRRIASFDPSGLPAQIAGEIPAYKIGDYVPKSYRKATKVMARDIELAVIAADDAFKDAGLQSRAYTDAPTIDSRRFGCNIGAGLISVDLNELTGAMHAARDGNRLDLERWGREGMSQLTPLWLLKYLPNMLACHVTIIHELKGPSNTITCADASSHLAIGEAFRTIQRGDADLAICGGAETKVVPMSLMRQILLQARHRIAQRFPPSRRFARSMPNATERSSARAAACSSSKNTNMPRPAAPRFTPSWPGSPPARIRTASRSPTPAAAATPRRSPRRWKTRW